jgi:hypothetical protein
MSIEYKAGNWNFQATGTDNDAITYNLLVLNISQDIFFNQSNTNGSFIISSLNFTDFDDNPFNITINLNDGDNVSSYSYQINITDNYPPVIVGFVNVSVTNNTIHYWNENMTDDYLWAFNISCDNGFNYTKDSIAATTYNFQNSSLITKNTICNVSITDGHTVELINEYDIWKITEPGKESTRFENTVINHPNSTLTYEKQYDRYSFCIQNLQKEKQQAVIMLPDTCKPAQKSKYKGHYVCLDDLKWIDFEGYDNIEIKDNTITIKEINDKACFNSIGSLNQANIVQNITIKTTNIGSFDTTSCMLDRNQSWIIGYLGLMFAMLAIIIINLVWIRLPFAGVFLGFAWILLTLSLYACSALFGAIFSLFGILLIVLEFWLAFADNAGISGRHG